ncbi:MAG: hypothetical protein O3C21_02165, partial [Verrucomicrobia bacterium]|nr:hypothetical protein [Verrucomicrobiota bacterium]
MDTEIVLASVTSLSHRARPMADYWLQRRTALFYPFKCFLTFSLCVAGWVLTVSAQEEVERPAASSMSLKQCVILALQQTFDLKIQEVSRDIAAARVGVAKAEYEPALTATIDYRDTTDPGGTDVQTGAFVGSKTPTVRADSG